MKIGLKNILPSGGKLNFIYRGVVEDNIDPDKRGRVRVRVFGLHTHEKETKESIGIPTEHLPWAEPVCSIIEGSISGCGVWAVPVQGSHVFVFFENGNIMQPRYFATAPGIPQEKSDSNIGFGDPDNEYPLEDWLEEADWHRLARDETEDTYIDTRRENLIKNAQIEEPEPFYLLTEEKYPHNIVVGTHGGHIFEIDNTEEGKRFHYYHPSNSYFEINNDGDLILRNEGDRWNIIGADLEEYIAGTKTGVIVGKEKRYIIDERIISVSEKETKTVLKDQLYSITGSQTLVANTQYLRAKTNQNLSAWVNQNISVKGNQSISCWGNTSNNFKGNYARSALGRYNDTIGGMYSKSIYGITSKFSYSQHFIGSPVQTNLGFSPMGTACSTVNAAIDGVTGAIREAMQPIFDVVNTIKSEIDTVVNEVIEMVNNVLMPITDIVNDINAIADYVKQEYNYAVQLVTTVQNLPYTLVRSIVNKANSIINLPGTLIYSTIGKLSSSTSNIKLLQSLSKLNSTAKDLGLNLKINLSDYTNLKSNLINFSQYDLNQYVRSGISSYDGIDYARKNIDNFYYDTGSVTVSGNLQEEMDEHDQFITDALSASFLAASGDFIFDDALDNVYSGQVTYLKNILYEKTIEQLLSPDSMVKPGTTELMIDVDTLNVACSGYFIDPLLENEFTPEDWEDIKDMTVDEALLETISPSASAMLIDTRDNRIPDYAEAVIAIIKEQVRSVFNILLQLEVDVRSIISGINFDSIIWEGKYNDWSGDL